MEDYGYIVTFSYSIPVRAKDKKEAEANASKIWDEITPRTDEMNISVDEEN